ncbi:DNA methyltransferase [Candidatus Cloacimonas acidaminovorans]|uniref:Modification methylase, type III R/M system n=1 Tax=Cloacimonas acidaminovorans (strain Evry) TaxID=459349 RepID=B0VHZ5_CLOAI|nr:site-specific DNA-methyltransferase [Candidatus Cloacimonas acidaminovorans]CAO80966.1 Modification methylase, type III R/M system [Candidatus Cloacimonas acidaminovorans str. Evry]
MDSITKFQELLKGLFQFETSDLDFGIYRILNYKRDRIKKFIEDDLVTRVKNSFAKYEKEIDKNLDEQIDKQKKVITENIGINSFTPAGEIIEKYADSNLGKEYTKLLERKKNIEQIEEIKLQVFNDLFNFFSRYYEEGDFVPQYRYSNKKFKYAIPYDGEEVKLYWANYDQYYTKTGVLFRDYTFKAVNHRVIFRIVAAKEELGSKKATKERFFVLDEENPWQLQNNDLLICFQYRELEEKEVNAYQVEGGSNSSKQEKINQQNYTTIVEGIKDIYTAHSMQSEYIKIQETLLYQLNRFTSKNTKDYFIHKDLKKFLSEQLEFFIKDEVLNIDTMEQAKFLDKHITRAKVVRDIGTDIIDFLAQIENFQKRLWEKKKFVLSTNYVISLDRICQYTDKEFLTSTIKEILKNQKQLQEWEELGFGKIEKEADLYFRKDLIDTEYKKLPLDTKYFSPTFQDTLLEKLTEHIDLNELLDGLLIKSENWQALNTILPKFKEQIQTIYIDPPFNKEQDADYLYNVKYKDSTWASLLENRLSLAKNIMKDSASIFVRCDYNGNWVLRPVMNYIFYEDNFRNEIIVNKSVRMKTEGKVLLSWHDVILCYCKNSNNVFFCHITENREKQEWRALDMEGEKWDIVPNDMINMFSPNNLKYDEKGNVLSRAKIILGKEIIPRQGRRFPNQVIINKMENDGLLRYSSRGNPQMLKPDIIYLTDDWTGFYGYSFNWDFPTENSEILLKRVIESTSDERNIVMDFFLGSGTTTAVAQKLGRKWIGIEMGEHFWSVVMPRMKKVLFYDKSGISKEKDVQEKYNEHKAGGFFQYQVLEQYEDTLDNLEIKEPESEQIDLSLSDEYLFRYFIDFETRENSSLLNIEKLKTPFSYKLKVNLEEVGEPQEIVVDLPETFNYLLGLKVKRMKVRNQGRKYLFISGQKGSQEIAVVWRDYNDNWNEDDYNKDRDFIMEQLKDWEPQIVYINGQNNLTPDWGEKRVEIRSTDSEFKRLMG